MRNFGNPSQVSILLGFTVGIKMSVSVGVSVCCVLLGADRYSQIESKCKLKVQFHFHHHLSTFCIKPNRSLFCSTIPNGSLPSPSPSYI